jgi:hypothetical protein
MGQKCSKFMDEIDQKRQNIQKELGSDFELRYKKFRYSWVPPIDKNGEASIRCSVELHSENAQYLFAKKTYDKLFWVCDNEESVGICAHYRRECKKMADELSTAPMSLGSEIDEISSLLQGDSCYIRNLTVYKKSSHSTK